MEVDLLHGHSSEHGLVPRERGDRGALPGHPWVPICQIPACPLEDNS